MTAVYLLIQDDQELADLALGHVSPSIREMARFASDEYLAELLAENAAKPTEKIEPKPRTKKKTKAA